MRVRRRDRLRFSIERFLLGGVGNRLMIAAAIVLTVAVVAGGLLSLTEGEFAPDEAVWWAFLRLTDPGYLGDDEGVARRIISTVVTVLGYLLFLGLLIAILTQWLNDTIRRLESGVTPVGVRDHVLVLGSTDRTPAVLRQLLQTRNRVARFLARHGASQLRIVVLSEEVDATVARELRERVGDAYDDRQVILRAGSPLRLEHLERVAFADAAVIIVPGGDHAGPSAHIVDAETVKTLRALSVHGSRGGRTLPTVVAELGSGQSATVAHSAYEGACETIAGDEIVGYLIAQSLIQRGIFEVLREILTLNDGNSVFLRAFEAESAATLDEIRRDARGAIPIGFIRAGERRPQLNPGPDVRVEPGDLVVFLARRHHDCELSPSDRPLAPRATMSLPIPEPGRRRRVLVLGWSRKVPAMLSELARYGADAFDVHLVSSKPVPERIDAIASHGVPLAVDCVTHTAYSSIATGVIDGLEPEHYDHIVMVASEQLANAEQADAATVFAHELLRARLPRDGTGPKVFVELLSDDDLFLFDRAIEDVIVSPTVASFLVSQVALRPQLVGVFHELTKPWGAQIVLHPASEWLRGDATPIRFEDLEHLAAERGQIALGVQIANGELQLNPGREVEWALGPADRIVTLATFEEPA